jgi:hypothetical protein
MYKDVQEYLNSKKPDGKIIPNFYERELFITSHESLRIGESAYLLQNLNLQKN